MIKCKLTKHYTSYPKTPIADLLAFPWEHRGRVVDDHRTPGRDGGSLGFLGFAFDELSGCVGYASVAADGVESADEPVSGSDYYSACARCIA